MEKIYYYIYCKGILGVKTNISDFKWIYGSVAPTSSFEEYEKCIVKFEVFIKPEKQLSKSVGCDFKFQSYNWNAQDKLVSYRRKFLGNIEIGYDLQLNGNTVYIELGQNYYKFIKNRTMNLHGAYYLLSDLANVILLKNGFITLYASAVYFEPMNKCTVNFAPPNTGKTYLAVKLCENYGYKLVGEDVVICDGNEVYSCPWTNSYRKSSKSIIDSSGSLRKSKNTVKMDMAEQCKVTDMTVLSIGKTKLCIDKERFLNCVSMLNGYLFNHYSSPIVKIIGYFEKDYDKQWSNIAHTLLKNMVDSCSCHEIQSQESVEFAKILHKDITGENL